MKVEEIVERLRAALSQAAVTPGFGSDMEVWSNLAGSVQQAATALTDQAGRIERLVEALKQAEFDFDRIAHGSPDGPASIAFGARDNIRSALLSEERG